MAVTGGGLRARRALQHVGAELLVPLVALQGAAFLVLVLSGLLAPLAGMTAFVVVAVGTALLMLPLARGLATMGRWLADLDDHESMPAPALKSGPAGRVLAVIAAEARARLEEREQRIDHLTAETGRMLDTLPDPLLMLSRDRRVLRLNRSARGLFGERSAGRDLSRVLRDPALDDAVDRVLAGEAGSSVEVAFKAARVEMLFAVDVAPLPLGGNGGPAVMAMFHDITAIRRTEQMRVDFVANASHEIRSPLATLIGCVETLQGPARDDAEARDRFLEMMDDQGRRMARLVNDLLSLSRIELKEHAQPTGTVDIAQMLERLQTSLMFDADEKEMTIELDVEPGISAVRGDEGEVEQAAYNLMTNAIKYGRRGGVVSVSAGSHDRPPEHLRIARGSLVWVRVHNEGEGIAAHHIPRLTERFYRIDTARSRQMGGTGLGLAIVKHVLNRHRGELQVESGPGQGATFTLWLPAATDPDEV